MPLRKQDNGNFMLSQRNYTEDLIMKHGGWIHNQTTPLPTKKMKQADSVEQVDKLTYQEFLGSVSFLRQARPDISHAIHEVARASQ